MAVQKLGIAHAVTLSERSSRMHSLKAHTCIEKLARFVWQRREDTWCILILIQVVQVFATAKHRVSLHMNGVRPEGL